MKFNSRLLLFIAPIAVLLPVGLYLWHAGSRTSRPEKPAWVAQSKPPSAAVAQPAVPAVPFPAASKEQAVPSQAAAPAPVQPSPEPVADPPKPLANVPRIVRGVYLTSWSAGLKRRIDYVEDLARANRVNSVVIDIKDYSGYVSYRVAVPEAYKYQAIRVTVRDIDSLVRRLHASNVYTIARITVFQDPILAVARPDFAVHRKSLLKGGIALSKDTLWRDRKGLAWIDPSSRGAWEYVAAIGRDALKHGFDELNFDYVRFPSDGDMKDMHFPASGDTAVKPAVIRSFFAYLRKQFPDAPISADLFGLATVNSDDLGIGQVIEDAYRNFDYVCPMVYPSHYARGFRGFPNPAEHPFEVVKYSMDKAVGRLRAIAQGSGVTAADAEDGSQAGGSPQDGRAAGAPGRVAKLRPWLQDFDLGANYDAAMVRAQIRATVEALGADYAGYLMWSPSNVYTAAALDDDEKRAAGAPISATTGAR